MHHTCRKQEVLSLLEDSIFESIYFQIRDASAGEVHPRNRHKLELTTISMLRSFALAAFSLALTCDAHTHSQRPAFSLPPAVRGRAYAGAHAEGRPRRCKLAPILRGRPHMTSMYAGRAAGMGQDLIDEKLEYEVDSAGRPRLK